MDQFTPGNWRATYSSMDMNAEIRGKNNALVAIIWSGRKPSEETVRANAALIENAPVMLAALRRIANAPSGMSPEWYESIARDALKI
jgi:hypothetical protein